MIAHIRGTLVHKSPTEVVLDVEGVGYALLIPLSTFEKLAEPGAVVTLLTHLHVREDALVLYGFASEEERWAFRLLISVSGIGPRMAQGILSGVSVADLRLHLSSGNSQALTAVPGIGPKLAERLIVELRGKAGRSSDIGVAGRSPGQGDQRFAEAVLALTSLGYSRQIAERAVAGVEAEVRGEDASLEAIIKSALRRMAK